MDLQTSRIGRRRSKTRQHIIETALDLFIEKGIRGISFDQIAEQSDISRGTLYSHFSNKEELVEEILKPVLIEAAGSVAALTEWPPLVAIDKLLNLLLDLWKNYQTTLLLIYKLNRAELGALAALHDDYLEKIIQLFEKIERTDLLRYSDPRLTALVIYKTAIPLLETLQNLDDFDCLFISSMKSLIFKNIP
jgi:AcrR family transcriptional regulator